MDKQWYIVVSKSPTYCNGVGSAYMCGSKLECYAWQLAHGMRATTEVIPF